MAKLPEEDVAPGFLTQPYEDFQAWKRAHPEERAKLKAAGEVLQKPTPPLKLLSPKRKRRSGK
jgi:hypothetical protein